MTWLLANAAEVLERFNDAGSKQLFPISIYGDPCGQRLAGRKEPPGESESVVRFAVRKLRKDPRDIGREVTADFVEKVSALKFPRGSPFISLLLRHYRNVHGTHLGELPFEVFEPGEGGRAFRVPAQRSPAGIAARSETNALHDGWPRVDLAQLFERDFEAGALSECQRLAQHANDPAGAEELRVGRESLSDLLFSDALLGGRHGSRGILQV